ncbi:hypothetical protein [Sphingomonas immobilis]|uniref:Uncharacterized protein n=1 Tax=Sphingomonas immobilis TaxID=3063997 RepID=A0ABT9A4Y4_9SPHN|nr:hypothetical protein [Sphingomonas sp. CA1-15]MDO7844593.1 hypothetical protein [Sphingomonas sp. CA1-15]
MKFARFYAALMGLASVAVTVLVWPVSPPAAIVPLAAALGIIVLAALPARRRNGRKRLVRGFPIFSGAMGVSAVIAAIMTLMPAPPILFVAIAALALFGWKLADHRARQLSIKLLMFEYVRN